MELREARSATGYYNTKIQSGINVNAVNCTNKFTHPNKQLKQTRYYRHLVPG